MYVVVFLSFFYGRHYAKTNIEDRNICMNFVVKKKKRRLSRLGYNFIFFLIRLYIYIYIHTKKQK